MTTREKILSSIAPVVVGPAHVFINEDKIKEVAQDLLMAQIPSWDNNLQFLGTPEETAQYYFFVDSINFCFWAPKGQMRWEYKIGDKWVGGYYAYSCAIKEAFERDKRLLDAEYLSKIPEKDFRSIFIGRNSLLLIDERLDIIRKNFSILLDKFDGRAINVLKTAENDADKLVALLVEHFPTFRDKVTFKGKEVYFLKRAQIFTSDLSFVGLAELKLTNLNHLTAFADYKLPQILESFGVLTYSPELNADIVGETPIQAGSLKEIELRASSVVAIERIRDEMTELGRDITINELDWILWVKAKETSFTKPHHKTVTTFY